MFKRKQKGKYYTILYSVPNVGLTNSMQILAKDKNELKDYISALTSKGPVFLLSVKETKTGKEIQ